jgi:hypothetical protein
MHLHAPDASISTRDSAEQAMSKPSQNTVRLQAAIFDHVLWALRAADGCWRRGEIMLGECLLLFTSLDSLHAFLEDCADTSGREPDEPQEPAVAVFSRNRREFGERARQAARSGVVGALLDPPSGSGEAPFLGFARTQQ